MKRIIIKIYEWARRRLMRLKRRFVAPQLPVNPEGKIYVNVGCGDSSGKEFINVDVLPYPNIHHIHDIADLSMFADNSVDLIYASHVVEHIPRESFNSTIKEWQRALKPGGILRISVPDFDKLIAVYEGNERDILTVRDQVLGQKPPYDNHYTLWNFAHAQKTFSDLGFAEIRRWDSATANHHDFKDRSSRQLNSGGKEIAISLNVEAVKAGASR